MFTYFDTNILSYAYSGEEIDICKSRVTSINALEFLKNIEKERSNSAKYYIPFFQSKMMFENTIPLNKRERPFTKKYTDCINFDFLHDFPSFNLYNNLSITNVINNSYSDLFNLSISFLNKVEFKEIRKKFEFIISNKIVCDAILEDDIILGYSLLKAFVEKNCLKKDFRNCWNDFLILAKCINQGGQLYSSDKLLNRFAGDCYSGKCTNIGKNMLSIKFPDITENDFPKTVSRESKEYINRPWTYKIKNVQTSTY